MYNRMYVLPPKACTTCPWLPLIWNLQETPVSGSSNSQLSPPLHSEHRRSIYYFCSSTLWLKNSSCIMMASTGCPQKKLLKKMLFPKSYQKRELCGQVWGTWSSLLLLAPSGALIAIPTYYWSTSTPTFSDHTGNQHWTFTFWAITAI